VHCNKYGCQWESSYGSMCANDFQLMGFNSSLLYNYIDMAQNTSLLFNNCTRFNFMILWDTLSSLFHAFWVYDLGIILLKGVSTFTKVNS
jgi:hypothetical protein